MTPVPDGTPVSEEMSLYHADMTISAYGRKMRYESHFTGVFGGLRDTDTGALGGFLTSCTAVVNACTAVVNACTDVVNAKGIECGSEYELTPRLTCDWADCFTCLP